MSFDKSILKNFVNDTALTRFQNLFIINTLSKFGVFINCAKKNILRRFISDGLLFKKEIWPAVLNFVQGLKGLILLNCKD